MNNFREIVDILIKKNQTISFMESCTGGAISNEITSITNSSTVFKFGAVTYSNEYKIKMGVRKEIIEKYTVYSIETAKEMAKAISNYTNSSYGVGVTGQINKQDPYNSYGTVGEVFYSIYDKQNNKFYEYFLKTNKQTRLENKKIILDNISENIISVIS